MTVNTRKKEKPEGTWKADARWGDSSHIEPSYELDLVNEMMKNTKGWRSP